MTKFKLFHLKNEMLAANFLANLIGVFGANAMLHMAAGRSHEVWEHAIPYWIDVLFTPFAFAFVIIISLVYEKPDSFGSLLLSLRTRRENPGMGRLLQQSSLSRGYRQRHAQ